VIVGDHVADVRRPSEPHQDQPADAVHFVVLQFHAQRLAGFLDA